MRLVGPVLLFLPCVALAQPVPTLRNADPAAAFAAKAILPHATSYSEFWGAYADGEKDMLPSLRPGMLADECRLSYGKLLYVFCGIRPRDTVGVSSDRHARLLCIVICQSWA